MSRDRAELVAVGLAAFEAGGDFDVVAVSECGAKSVQLILEVAQRAKHFIAILLEDGAPDFWVTRGDPRGVAQTATGVVAPRGILFCEENA